MDFIYHITRAVDWEQALQDGEYTVATLGRTLADEGFIHGSHADQVQTVRDTFYRDVPDLVLLVIDPGLVNAPIRYDVVPGQPEPFPHVYGPLNTDAVIEVRPL